MSKLLREYQQQAIDTSFSKLEKGISKQIISLPTGCGKTLTAVKLTEQGNFNRVLWITDAEELIEQSALAFLREKFDDSLCDHISNYGFIDYVKSGGCFAGSNYKVGLIKADTFQPYGNVVMASQQTLHRRLHLLQPDQFDCVIIDECHTAASNTAVKSLNYFNPKLLLGISATPTRTDNMQLGDIFDEIVYQYDLHQAIKDGYLVELDGVRIKTNVNLDSVKSKGGDLNESQLADEINTPARNNLIANSYLKYCNGKQAIGFAVDIRHAIDLAEAFKSKGINAEAVSSNEELTGDRTQKIKDFKSGNIQVLFNVGILVKGFDHDEVACIIMARPTKSLTLYLQALGRGTRTLTGVINGLNSADERIWAIKQSRKPHCTILDIVDNTTKHNLINTFELDKRKPLEERTFLTQEKRDKIADERAKRHKLDHERKEDEVVKLLQLPQFKISNSIRMTEPATEAQLQSIKRWGYDIENNHYTKKMISEIYGNQQASEAQIWRLKKIGYDCSGFVSVVQARIILDKYFKK
jgi:superfamily II DNA or RNA helicase